MPFSPAVKKEALVRSGRFCNICRESAGLNINVHHMIPEAEGGSDDIDNALVLCLKCHSEVGHCYNNKHPIGNKYSPDELRKHRDKFWELLSSSAKRPGITTMNVRARPDLDERQAAVGGMPTPALHISISHEHTESVHIHKASIQPCAALHVHGRAIAARASALLGEAYELKFAEEWDKSSDLSEEPILSTFEWTSATPLDSGERRLIYIARERFLKSGEEAFTFLPLSEPVVPGSIKQGDYGIVCLEYSLTPSEKLEGIFPVK